MWYAVLAVRTIFAQCWHVRRLSSLLLSDGCSWARLSACLPEGFARVRLWFHQGASLLTGRPVGTARSMTWWRREVMLATARRVSSCPYRSVICIPEERMCLAKISSLLCARLGVLRLKRERVG